MLDHFDVIAIGALAALAGAGYVVLVLHGQADAGSVFRDAIIGCVGAIAGVARSGAKSA